MGSCQFGIGLTAGTEISVINELNPTVYAGLGGIPAWVQHLAILKDGEAVDNLAIAALVAQVHTALPADGYNSIAVKGKVLAIFKSVCFAQGGDSFFLLGFILYIEDSGLLASGIASKTGATCIVLKLASVIRLVEQYNTIFGFISNPLCTGSTSGAVSGDSVQRIT